MIQLQLNGKTLGVADVPDDADCFEMSELGRVITFELLDDNCDQYDWDYIKPPPGQWSILGRLNDITEEQAAMTMPKQYLPHSFEIGYQSYPENDYNNNTGVESLKQFFRSHGITGNPLVLLLNEGK